MEACGVSHPEHIEPMKDGVVSIEAEPPSVKAFLDLKEILGDFDGLEPDELRLFTEWVLVLLELAQQTILSERHGDLGLEPPHPSALLLLPIFE